MAASSGDSFKVPQNLRGAQNRLDYRKQVAWVERLAHNGMDPGESGALFDPERSRDHYHRNRQNTRIPPAFEQETPTVEHWHSDIQENEFWECRKRPNQLKSDAAIFGRATSKSAQREEFSQRFAGIAIVVHYQKHLRHRVARPTVEGRKARATL